MNLNTLNLMLAQAAPAAGQPQDLKTQLVTMLPMLTIMGVMFYLLLIRPQQKRAKEQAKMLEALKAGDKIVTTGGIVGVVIAVKDKTVSIRSADAKMEVLKSVVGEITERANESAEVKS